jgi:hypothetical protein
MQNVVIIFLYLINVAGFCTGNYSPGIESLLFLTANIGRQTALESILHFSQTGDFIPRSISAAL